MRPGILRAGAAALAAGALLAACGGDDDAARRLSGAPGDPAEREATAGAAGAPPRSAYQLVGEDVAFDTTALSARVGETMTITFDNRDAGIAHNLRVHGDGVDERTEIVTGPVVQTLEVTVGAAGELEFVCEVHPVEMMGVITIR